MCRCLVDVCPVEDLKTYKTEITAQITQKEESPEPPPPKEFTPASQPEIEHAPPRESAVEPEPDGEDHAIAKTPSPVVSPVIITQPETAASGPSTPAVVQVIKQIRAVMRDCYLIATRDCYSETTSKDSYFRDRYSAKATIVGIGSIWIVIWQLERFAILGTVILLLQLGIGIVWIGISKMRPATAFLRTAIPLLKLRVAFLPLQLGIDMPRIAILIFQFRFAMPVIAILWQQAGKVSPDIYILNHRFQMLLWRHQITPNQL